MGIIDNIEKIKHEIPSHVKLIAVSKTKPTEDILEAYDSGQIVFGENKVQELVAKHEILPNDIEWHMIGHLQRNKVKQVITKADLIHGVDSVRLLKEINKEAGKKEIISNCLLQFHIASESTKFGFLLNEVFELLENSWFENLDHVNIVGVMGMATNTTDTNLIRKEFESLRKVKEELESHIPTVKEISMGMSNDYEIAIDEGSTMIRVGSKIFGARNYNL